MPSAIVFDAYGTLFDVHAVDATCERRFPGAGSALSTLWRVKQLEYTWLRSLMGRYEDFWQVTGSALDHACAALRLPLDARTRAALMDSYLDLSPYPEVRDALASLSQRRLAILSNGTPRMLAAAVESARLGDRFAQVLSVDPVRVYKPAPAVYRLAVAALEVESREILFVSSNGWDVAGASSFGFPVCWVNRSGAPPEQLGVRPALTVRDLRELAARLAG